MNREYINKIIEIGKKGSCSSEELDYFRTSLPHIANLRDLQTIEQINRLLGNDNADINQSTFLFINFVKGCHLIEMKNDGFGSTSATHQMIERLQDENIVRDLYNWIASNGGNYFIEKNISFEDRKKNDREAAEKRKKILENDQKIHIETVARKQHNRDLHSKSSDETRKLYKEVQEKLQEMDDDQLVTAFNKNVGISNLGAEKERFHSAIYEMFKSRGFDFSAIGNNKRLFFANKITLIGKKIVKNSNKK